MEIHAKSEADLSVFSTVHIGKRYVLTSIICLVDHKITFVLWYGVFLSVGSN